MSVGGYNLPAPSIAIAVLLYQPVIFFAEITSAALGTDARLWDNRLNFDLASVPGLTELRCENNLLTELDLASVPWLIAFSVMFPPLRAMATCHRAV